MSTIDLREINRMLDAERERIAELKAQRQRLSLDAVSGNTKARTQLTQIKKEIADCQSTIESSELALKESSRRLAEQHAMQRADAQKQLEKMQRHYDDERESRLRSVLDQTSPSTESLE